MPFVKKIAGIQHEMTRRVMANFIECVQHYVDSNGTHLTDIIFEAKLNKVKLYVHFGNKNKFFFLQSIWLLLLTLQI